MLANIKYIIKQNIVAIIAFILAIITIFFVPFDKEYINYFDYKTLTCLFLVSLVVGAFKNINFFYIIARNLIIRFHTLRYSYIALIYITFLGSMLIANDMALITFLPLGYLVLKETNNEKYEAFVFIMQNTAANLGGMLTPFGNPQNLYLYSKFNINTFEFLSIMIIPFLVAIFIITLSSLLLKNEPLTITNQNIKLPSIKSKIYVALFLIAIAIIFRRVPYGIGLIIIPAIIFLLDREAFFRVDYGLLLTFVFFFIFSGNLARLDIIKDFFSTLLKKNTLLTSILCCQIMSNVPSSILLSHFTNNYRALLYGVNIGGLGTLIASLASLITFREYTRLNKGKTLYYLTMFTTINIIFVVILYIVCEMIV